jgi:predicted TIM-barrel fold metal-dependent hydrolase
MIIDSQVHIWLADRPNRPWQPGAKAQLPQPFSAEDMIARMDEGGVDAAVIVPPPWEGNRNDYALKAVERYPGRFGVMGLIDIDQPDSREQVRNWRKQPGMLGIRFTFSRRQATSMTDSEAAWFWEATEEAGIPLMLHVPHADKKRGLGEVAARHPKLRLIVDHMGLSTEIREHGHIGEAIAATEALARHPNIYVKVSSVPTFSAESYPFRDFDGHLRKLVSAFGARRCFWGTDLTKALHKCSYRQRVTHFTEALDFLSADDKAWIMGKGIVDCLNWKR